MVMFASNPPLPNAKFGSHFHQTLLGTSSDTLHSSVALHQKKNAAANICWAQLCGYSLVIAARTRNHRKIGRVERIGSVTVNRRQRQQNK